ACWTTSRSASSLPSSAERPSCAPTSSPSCSEEAWWRRGWWSRARSPPGRARCSSPDASSWARPPAGWTSVSGRSRRPSPTSRERGAWCARTSSRFTEARTRASDPAEDLPAVRPAPELHALDVRLGHGLAAELELRDPGVDRLRLVSLDVDGLDLDAHRDVPELRQALREHGAEPLDVDVVLGSEGPGVVTELRVHQGDDRVGVARLEREVVLGDGVDDCPGVPGVLEVGSGDAVRAAPHRSQENHREEEAPHARPARSSATYRLSTGASASRIFRPSAWIIRSPIIASGLSRNGSCSLISPSSVRSVRVPEGRSRSVPVFTSIREMEWLVGTLLKVISLRLRS